MSGWSALGLVRVRTSLFYRQGPAMDLSFALRPFLRGAARCYRSSYKLSPEK